MQRCAIIWLAVSLTATGCARQPEQKPADQAAQQVKQGAEQVAKGAQQGATEAAKGLEQMARGIEAMAKGAGGGAAAVDPVSFHDLQMLFPDIDGWEKEKPTGERMTKPVSYSQAEVHYK